MIIIRANTIDECKEQIYKIRNVIIRAEKENNPKLLTLFKVFNAF